MNVAIIAEGPSDMAVLMNILYGKLGVQRKDIVPLRPELSLDETDLSASRKSGYQKPPDGRFSNWEWVIEECRRRAKVLEFLDKSSEEERFVIVHIDTAEADKPGYDIQRPSVDAPGEYVETLRTLVVKKLTELLGTELAPSARFAVAVEETDAWLLPLYDPSKKDTGLRRNPKKRLHYVLEQAEKGKTSGKRANQKPAQRKKSAFDRYWELSEDLREKTTLAKCAAQNRSLALFLASLDSQSGSTPPDNGSERLVPSTST